MKKFFTSMLLAGAVMFGMQAQDLNVWVLGNVGDQTTWDPSVGTLMTWNEQTECYELTVDFKANSYFSFTTALAETSSGWDEIRPYRFGAPSNDYVVDDNLGNPIACGDYGASADNAFLIKGAANYTISLMIDEEFGNMVAFERNGDVVTEPDPVDEGHIYLMGDVNNIGWVTNTSFMMNEEGNNIFTANINVVADSIGYFGFTHARSTMYDNSWDAIAQYRFAAVDSINSEVVLGEPMAVGDAGNFDYSFALAPGKYIITLDLNANTLTVVENTANYMYIIGNDPFGGWNPAAGMEMEEVADGIFEAKATFEGDVWFIFSGDSGSWDAVNALRYGPADDATEDEVVTPNEEVTTQLTTSGKSYKITGDGSEYTITFNLNTLTFKFAGGSVTPGVPGDYDGSGIVDITDVNAVINMMLGKEPYKAICDMDGTGNIDISEVNMVINAMLGK